MSAAEVARGKRLIGVRLGGAVTRSAPWRIADRAPELGWLTGSRRLAAGQPVPEQLTSPQAVPHLAFVLGGPLTGSGVSPAGALAAVASVHAAVELAAGDSGPDMLADGAAAGDSGPDVIADGAAAGWFLVSPAGACGRAGPGPGGVPGRGGRPSGRLRHRGAAAGHPAEALAWAASALDGQGLALEPGWLVLTGALTAPVPLPPGTPLAVHFTTLGSLFVPSG